MVFVFIWLTYFSIIPSRSTHVAANGKISFFFMAEEYSIVHIYHIFIIHSSVSGHLGCFHSLAIKNNADMTICVQISVWTYVFISLGYLPRNRIIGSYENSVYHVRNWDCFPKWLHLLTFLPAVPVRVLFSLHLHQHFLSFFFFLNFICCQLNVFNYWTAVFSFKEFTIGLVIIIFYYKLKDVIVILRVMEVYYVSNTGGHQT